jgi:hypothetical protein
LEWIGIVEVKEMEGDGKRMKKEMVLKLGKKKEKRKKKER